MKPYPSYKVSGVEWLDDVPEHWKVGHFGYYFKERKEKVSDKEFSALSVTRNGIVPQLETAAKTDDGDNRKLVKTGDFVINSRSDRKGSSGLSNLEGSVSLISIVLKVSDEIWGQFAHWLLKSINFQEEFYRWGAGIVADLWSTRYADMKTITIAAPPLTEQRAIAAFLDREVAKIDALIEEQRRLIALLAEKRQATISHAVTKGLDPNAKMKPSGIEWLSEIPEGWQVVRLRRVVTNIEQGFSPECLSYPAAFGEWGVLKTSCVNKGIYVEQENKALPSEISPRPDYEVHEGDVLMSRASGSTDLIGSVAMVKATQGNILLSDKVFRLKLTPSVSPAFFTLSMGSLPLRAQIVNAVSGGEGMANNIPQKEIKAFWIAIPPLSEQIIISSHLSKTLEELDALSSASSHAIELLQERRSALISAAVTGKIDVRDLVPSELEPA